MVLVVKWLDSQSRGFGFKFGCIFQLLLSSRSLIRIKRVTMKKT